jgi:hypothetical protein
LDKVSRIVPICRQAGHASLLTKSQKKETLMESIMKYLPLLVPVLALQIILLVIALIDLFRREKTRGPKWAWALAILFIQMIGSILYLVLGREEV